MRTYIRAGGCHDLEWLQSYLSEGLARTHPIHMREGNVWRWLPRGEEMALVINEDHCQWHHGRNSGRLTARVSFVRFKPFGR